MTIAQKYCEKCGLDYHNADASHCKNESPKPGSLEWNNGRKQVLANIYDKQEKLRAYVGDDWPNMVAKSDIDLYIATWGEEVARRDRII